MRVSGRAAPSSSENAEWQCSSTYSVIPSLHPPSGRVPVEHELPQLIVALTAPVVATVAIVPPIARQPLRADRIRDDNRATAPEDPARGGIAVDVISFWSHLKSESPDVHIVLGRACAV